MNFYQVGYYRKGLQGVDSGWDLIAPSEGISQRAALGFKGYAAGIIQEYTAQLYANPDKYPAGAYSIYLFDNYVFLCHFNFKAIGEDTRGVTYAHCYCFLLNNYLELSTDPSRLFALTKNAFPTEFDKSIDEFPVVEDIPHVSKDVSSILDKYGISDDNYRKLLLGALSAIEGAADSVCIKKTGIGLDEYEDFYQDMMYIVAMGLPHFLRIKLTGFSAPFGNKFDSRVFVSDSIETDNYVDLDAGVFHLADAVTSKYAFTQLYTNPQIPVRSLDKIYKQHFLEDAFELLENPLQDVDCTFINHLFFYWKKNEFSEPCEIDTDMVLKLIPEFLNYKPKHCAKMYDYLSTMLNTVYKLKLPFKDQGLIGYLMSMYEADGINHAAFKNEVEKLTLRYFIEGKEEKEFFDEFYEVKSHMPRLYDAACQMLRKSAPAKAYKLYLTKELPEMLHSMKDVQNYLKKMDRAANADVPNAFEQELDAVVGLYKQLAAHEMSNSHDNLDFIMNAKLAKEILEFIGGMGVYDDAKRNKLGIDIVRSIWSAYKLDWFDIESASDYQDIYLGKSRSVFEGDKAQSDKIDKLINLLRTFKSPFSIDTVKVAKAVAFTNEYNVSPNKAKEILGGLYDQFFEIGSEIPTLLREKAFDLLLAVTYDPRKKTFFAKELGSRLAEWKKEDMFLNINVETAVRTSDVLRNDYDKADQLIADISDYVDSANVRDKNSREYEIISGLKKYRTVLEGKELKEDVEIEATNSFLTTLYRGVVGTIAFTALALFALDIFKYFSLTDTTATIMLTVAASLIVICPVVAFIFGSGILDGLGECMADYGLDDIIYLIIYLSVVIILITALVLVFFLADIWYFAIAMFVCMFVALVTMIVRDLIVGE